MGSARQCLHWLSWLIRNVPVAASRSGDVPAQDLANELAEGCADLIHLLQILSFDIGRALIQESIFIFGEIITSHGIAIGAAKANVEGTAFRVVVAEINLWPLLQQLVQWFLI